MNRVGVCMRLWLPIGYCYFNVKVAHGLIVMIFLLRGSKTLNICQVYVGGKSELPPIFCLKRQSLDGPSEAAPIVMFATRYVLWSSSLEQIGCRNNSL
mmetsp:Transcript_15773/g.33357  ORF Transcript_15773/g.33357 Transcript_15773/m.33357 type:complete len:98 (-) Transcript_15773:785-1078(-)